MSDKLISQLTAAAGNLQDIDLAEGQKSGEVFSRKFTGLQMRGVEKAEREAQDNVIEAGAGLNANGTFTPPVNSWILRSADYTTGCTDRGGATGALTENILNGLRLLDAKVYQLANGSIVIVYMGLNADTTLTDVVPAGYMLEYVIFEELAGQSPILDLGTSAGGNEVFINQALTTSDLTTIVVDRIFSLTVDTTLYLNDDGGSTWDTSSVDAYFVLRPITAGGVVAGVNGTVRVGYYEGAYGLSSPPTEAEITAIIGDPTDYTAASLFIINDTATVLNCFYYSNGTNWYYDTSVFAQTA